MVSDKNYNKIGIGSQYHTGKATSTLYNTSLLGMTRRTNRVQILTDSFAINRDTFNPTLSMTNTNQPNIRVDDNTSREQDGSVSLIKASKYVWINIHMQIIINFYSYE